MKNLEARQREMRERNQNNKRISQSVERFGIGASDSPEVARLKKRISELEMRVGFLEKENRELREQKTVIVERAPQQSYDDAVREQRHNFFKYSNVRRY